MDIIVARTFLMVADTGSFIEAGRALNVTQSTVSSRIKGLEDQLGRPLFDRSNNGATLTGAGNQFQKHALAMVRVWQRAQLEVGLSAQHRDHLAVGAGPGLWAGFLVKWVGWLRQNIPDIAVSASAASPADLTERLVEGTLDLAVMYRPTQPPGHTIEHLFDEEIVQVTNAQAGGRRTTDEYVFVDWGPEFQLDHAAAYPELVQTSLNLDIGTASLDYLLANNASGYFPLRLVRSAVGRGRLKINKRARKFTYPVFMVYPEARDEEAYEPILDGLRKAVGSLR